MFGIFVAKIKRWYESNSKRTHLEIIGWVWMADRLNGPRNGHTAAPLPGIARAILGHFSTTLPSTKCTACANSAPVPSVPPVTPLPPVPLVPFVPSEPLNLCWSESVWASVGDLSLIRILSASICLSLNYCPENDPCIGRSSGVVW